MRRHSGLAHALLTGTLILTLGAGEALPQTATPTDEAAAADAAPAEQSRRGRERRRSAEPAETATAAPAGDAALAAPAAEIVDERMVCKNIKLTGTKISRRICGTPEQWAAQEKKTTDDAQEAMRQVRDRSSIVVSQPDSPLSRGGN